jgi:hypothetical protein
MDMEYYTFKYVTFAVFEYFVSTTDIPVRVDAKFISKTKMLSKFGTPF